MNTRAVGWAVLVVGMLAAPPAAAETERDRLAEAEALARAAAERLVEAIGGLIERIPQYEAPEITDEGDIIIRRKRKVPPVPEATDT